MQIQFENHINLWSERKYTGTDWDPRSKWKSNRVKNKQGSRHTHLSWFQQKHRLEEHWNPNIIIIGSETRPLIYNHCGIISMQAMIYLIKEDSSILPEVHLCLTMKCFRWNVVMFVSQSHLIFVSNGLSHWFYALWDIRSYSDLSICNACCLAIVQLAGHALVGVHQVTQRVIHLVLMIMATIMMMSMVAAML